jgi:hypothetical protein
MEPRFKFHTLVLENSLMECTLGNYGPFVNTHRLDGVIQGVGQGIMKTIDNKEMAMATGYGRGFTGVGGKMVYPTAQLYSTNSTGRLAFLNDVVGFSQWQVDNSGNYNYKMWKIK